MVVEGWAGEFWICAGHRSDGDCQAVFWFEIRGDGVVGILDQSHDLWWSDGIFWIVTSVLVTKQSIFQGQKVIL